MQVRPAIRDDADEMSHVLREIAALKGSTRRTDPEHVLRHYVEHPDRIECSVAVDETGKVWGFQSLKRAAQGNIYGVPPGWGIIGTHVSPQAARRGVGSALFAASRSAAERAGLAMIDATIGNANSVAQAYYDTLGFETYRKTAASVCKAFKVR